LRFELRDSVYVILIIISAENIEETCVSFLNYAYTVQIRMKTLLLSIVAMIGLSFILSTNTVYAQSNQYAHGIGSNSSALVNSIGLTYQQCQNKISGELQKIIDSLDRGKAVALALDSKDLQAKIAGHKYELTGISTNDTWDNSLCGNVKRTAVGVGFSLLDTPDTYLESVNVAEDANMTTIIRVGTEITPICTNNCPLASPPPIGNSFIPNIESDLHLTGMMVPNGTMPVSVDVTNQGNFTLYNVHVAFVDSPLLQNFKTGYGNFTLQVGQEKTILGTMYTPSEIPNIPSSVNWMIFASSQDNTLGSKEFHKTINLADKSTWTDNSVSFRTILPPLKQQVSVDQVQCRPGLNLIIKLEDYAPACVTPHTNQTLVDRGWGVTLSSLLEPLTIKKIEIAGLQQSYTPGQPINATVRFTGYEPGGVYPDVTIIDSNGTHVWNNCCIVHFEDPQFSFSTFTYIVAGPAGSPVINKTGSFTMIVSLDNKTAQTMFSVIGENNKNPSPLKLSLSTDEQIMQSGKGLVISISVNNTLPIQEKIKDVDEWPLHDLSLDPCIPRPFGIAIFDGYYTEQNMTDGKPLPIFNLDALCPVINATQSYVFEPQSTHATVSTCSDSNLPYCSYTQDMEDKVTIGGTWYEGNLIPFKPGVYTLVGGDEWGDVAIQYFTVTSSNDTKGLNQLEKIALSNYQVKQILGDKQYSILGIGYKRDSIEFQAKWNPVVSINVANTTEVSVTIDGNTLSVENVSSEPLTRVGAPAWWNETLLSCNGTTVPSPNYRNAVYPVLLMHPDSTSCVKLTYTVSGHYYEKNSTMVSWPRIETFPLKIDDWHYYNYGDGFGTTDGKDYTHSFNIMTVPGDIDLANHPIGSNFTVTYMIKPLPNATGFYDESVPMPPCTRYPLAVGYRADQVNSSDFSGGMITMMNHSCIVGQEELRAVEISGMNYTEMKLP